MLFVKLTGSCFWKVHRSTYTKLIYYVLMISNDCYPEIIPFTAPDPPTRKKPKTVAEKMQGRTMLDQFVSFEAGSENVPGIIINEDGTMVTAEGEVHGDI
jgi:hypothetical protein